MCVYTTASKYYERWGKKKYGDRKFSFQEIQSNHSIIVQSLLQNQTSFVINFPLNIHVFHSLFIYLPYPQTLGLWWIGEWWKWLMQNREPDGAHSEGTLASAQCSLAHITPPPWYPSSTSLSFFLTSLPDGIVVYQQEGTPSRDCFYVRPLGVEPNSIYP